MMATAATTTPNPKATTRVRREPLRPRSNNAATSPSPSPAAASARRGLAASAEKENQRPKSLAHGKEEDKGKATAATTTTAELSKPAEPAPELVATLPPPLSLKPSSLQLRMKDEAAVAAADAPPAVVVGPRGRELLLLPPPSSNYEAWDLSDSESAPASSWATLPNRALLCRPLPQDVGRCTCVIVREAATVSARGVALYSLYTNEGQGRQDRKLAVARHRRRRGRSEFVVAQNQDGIFCTSDNNFLGTVGANLVGSKYQIWGQGSRADELKNQSKRLLGVVAFAPTITTLTGSFRSMRAWIPKNQSMQLKTNNSAQIQHVSGLPKDWQEKKSRADQLCSRAPFYNHMTKRYELDFRERAGRMGYKVQTSVKNFQMTLEENGRQTLLQLGRVGKSKYILDFRYPLTGYQAFCICLASIDAKLCCTL